MNENELSYCRADKWHSAGFTGKGIKVGVFETSDSTINKTITRFANVIVAPQFSYKVNNTRATSHAQDVIDSLRFTAPDVEVHMLGSNYDENIQYAIDNKLDFINFSQNGYSYNDKSNALEAAFSDSGGVMVCAAGNDGVGTLYGTPLKDNWLSVASAAWRQWEGVYQPIHMAYSSTERTGTHLDISGFGELRDYDDTDGKEKGLSGTSFACPWVVGLLACWRQWFKGENGRNPTWQETFGFAIGNCTDMVDASQNIPTGYDVYTGYGILRLPETVPSKNSPEEVPVVEDVLELWIGKTTAKLNGKDVALTIAPILSDGKPIVLPSGRTFIYFRDVGELFGGTVGYVSNEQKIIVRKPRK